MKQNFGREKFHTLMRLAGVLKLQYYILLKIQKFVCYMAVEEMTIGCTQQILTSIKIVTYMNAIVHVPFAHHNLKLFNTTYQVF